VGVQLGMAYGEAPTSFVTPNIQLVVASSLVTNTGNLVLSTPLTASASSKAIPPKLVLGPSGLGACSYTGGYAQLSALQWSSNPYKDSKLIGSPLLRLSTINQPKDASATRALLAQGVPKNSVKYHFDKVPAYTISLQFSKVQSFNFTAVKNYTGKPHSTTNFTIPACVLFNGAKYVPCKGCNISSYTNYNVTYGCFDITQLCPTAIKLPIKRKLIGDGGQGGGPIYGSSDELEEEDEIEEEEGGEKRESAEGAHMRSLEEILVDEDQTSTYGMLVQSVIAELSDVLSSNPFLLNAQKSVAVLTFMSCLAGGILITILYLLGLDKTDLIHKNYVQRESDAAARKHLEYDLKHGGKGDLGESYQKYSEEFQSDKVAQASVMSSINRTRNKFGRMKKMGKIAKLGTIRKRPQIDILDPNLNNEDRALTEAKAQFTSPAATTVKYADSDEASSTDDDNNSDIVETDDQNTIAAIVTEFLHKLFPGRSIFFSKDDNVVGTVYTYHKYFCMFAGSELTKSRAIRFINIVAMVLTAIFTDTVFFGIYFPAVSQCIGHQDEVKQPLRALSTQIINY
jgi:hypothetical protein